MPEPFYPAVLSLSVLCYLLAGHNRLSPRTQRAAQFLAIAILCAGLLTAAFDALSYFTRQ